MELNGVFNGVRLLICAELNLRKLEKTIWSMARWTSHVEQSQLFSAPRRVDQNIWSSPVLPSLGDWKRFFFHQRYQIFANFKTPVAGKDVVVCLFENREQLKENHGFLVCHRFHSCSPFDSALFQQQHTHTHTAFKHRPKHLVAEISHDFWISREFPWIGVHNPRVSDSSRHIPGDPQFQSPIANVQFLVVHRTRLPWTKS